MSGREEIVEDWVYQFVKDNGPCHSRAVAQNAPYKHGMTSREAAAILKKLRAKGKIVDYEDCSKKEFIWEAVY